MKVLIICPVCKNKMEYEEKDIRDYYYLQCDNKNCLNPSIQNPYFEENDI